METIVPSKDYSAVSDALERPEDQTPRFWRGLVARFRNMDPDERAELYETIEGYASMFTLGHSDIVTSVLRELKELYHDIFGGGRPKTPQFVAS
jgi:hypothetical protein